MTHIEDDDLVMHAYGDGDARTSFDAHLAACAECRTRFDALTRDLSLMASVDVPARGDDYGSNVWDRLQPKLAIAPPRPRRLEWLFAGFTWPRLALVGSVATLVVAAFVAGRFTQAPATSAPTVAEASPQVVKERILLVAVGNHLDRSRVVLAEIVNRSDSNTADLAPERALAEDLVATNRLYRQTAVENGDPAMASALEELERMLVEIANSPEMVSGDERSRLRGRIESQGLLFKVTVLGTQVRQRQQDAAAQTPLSKSST